MTTTFKVSDVKREGPFSPSKYVSDLDQAFSHFSKKLGMRFEAVGGPAKVLPEGLNGFWSAIDMAFNWHIPLGLTPDHVWLTISRTFAEHVVKNAEELRKRFVDFDGQKLLTVRRDNFVKGSAENDWQGVFSEFSDQIAENIGKARDLVVCNFSTTGPVEKAASEVVLMDAMQKYFKYEIMTCCGIPEITLFGTTQDWMDVLVRTRNLGEYGLQEWVEDLLPVLEQFVRASTGDVDTEWWQSFYKEYSGSGSVTIDGHFTKFFPRSAGAPFVGRKSMSPSDIPFAVSKVPFVWTYYTESFDMLFVAGVPFATVQNGMMIPAAAWAVGEQA
jgi:hypothetical protein